MRLEPLGGRRRSGRGVLRAGLAVAVAVALAALVLVLRVGPPPSLSLEAKLPAIGPTTPLFVVAKAPGRGLSRLEVSVRQGDKRTVLLEERFLPRPVWQPFGPAPELREVEVVLERSQLPVPRATEATIEVVAEGAGTALRAAPTASVAQTFAVRLAPPRIAVLSPHIYVSQGGAEVVVYTVGETAVRHGVQAGRWFFPGAPLPEEGPRAFFSLFAAPFDLFDDQDIRLVATDDVGNEVKTSFIDKFTPRPFKTDTITVSDRFMEVVVPAIMAQTPQMEDQGSLLDNYLYINGTLRQENNRVLEALGARSGSKFFWRESFVQMPAKVVSAFADRRTYLYQGKKVDQQDHLGFDLASTQKDAIPAANDGEVVFAEYLGIYGNTVVLDHGHGLQTLYAHLSKIEVAVSEQVKRGATIGRTGATGLALGDHLHFTTMLRGLPVTPIEWWDAHWIRDRLSLKLGDHLGFQPGPGLR